MKKKVKSLDDLKDSRLLFEKELPAFGYMLLFIVVIALIALVIWSVKGKKPYVILTNGTITSSESAYVMSAYTGEIEQCYMEEGKLVQKDDVLFTIKSTEYNLQEEQLVVNRAAYEKQIEQTNLLVKSIKDNVNYFDSKNKEDELYYSTFEAYQSQVTQNTFDSSMYQAYGYTEEQIEKELEKNQGKISEIYYTAIQSAEQTIKEAQLQIDSIEAQLTAIGSGQSEYCVKASNTGVLHLLADYRIGMVVQTGSAVATITSEKSDRIVEAYVSTADMARINEGDYVQLAVDGLIQSVYGTLNGSILSIDSNVTSLEGENGQPNSVFKIKIRPTTDYVISKAGKKVNLQNGMTAEARITYDEITYFNYVLEKLGLLSWK